MIERGEYGGRSEAIDGGNARAGDGGGELREAAYEFVEEFIWWPVAFTLKSTMWLLGAAGMSVALLQAGGDSLGPLEAAQLETLWGVVLPGMVRWMVGISFVIGCCRPLLDLALVLIRDRRARLCEEEGCAGW